jgi:hypothetical protein
VSVHASQQLEKLLTQADPFLGGLHRLASLFVEHFVRPRESVEQQVTNPGLPQVERAAQRWRTPRQLRGSVPALTRSLSTPAEQLTYAPWLTAPAQSHCAATSARASATACASTPAGSHAAARTPEAVTRTNPNPRTRRTIALIAGTLL